MNKLSNFIDILQTARQQSNFAVEDVFLSGLILGGLDQTEETLKKVIISHPTKITMSRLCSRFWKN